MISIIDVYKSIKAGINSLDANIKVQEKDKKNPVEPCYRIDLLSDKTRQIAKDYEQTSLSFDIVYFSDKSKALDLMKKRESLKNLFEKPLEVLLVDKNDPDDEGVINYLEIDDVSFVFNEEDYILTCTIDLEVPQLMEITDDEYELVEDISLDIKIGE